MIGKYAPEMQPRSEGLLTAFSGSSASRVVTTAACCIRIIQRLLSDVVFRMVLRRNDSSSSRREDERVNVVSTMCFPVSPVVFICICTPIQSVPPQETTESCSRHMGGLVRVFGLDRVPSAGYDDL